MAFLTGVPTISEIDLYTSTTVNPGVFQVGALVGGANGKFFRFALNGASALIKGNLLQNAVNDTQFDALAVGTAGAIGDSFLQLTNGTTTVVPFQFQGGSVYCNTAGAGVAVGDEYTILDIQGTLTSGGALKVYTDRPLRYAYATTTTKVGIAKSVWGGVIQYPVTTQTGIPSGVAIYEIPASTATVGTYGFVQTHGVAATLSDNSTFAIGSMVSPSLAAAGAVGVNVAGTTHGTLGWAMHANETTKAIPVFLMLD